MYLVYLAIVLPYALLQTAFATAAMGRREARVGIAADQAFSPPVDVVITCYNEDPALLADCCGSVAQQDYAGYLRVFVVDDGSRNADELRGAMERVQALHPERDWTVMFLAQHANKRAVQDRAFRQCTGEIMVTVDSDTVLERDAVTRIVEVFADPNVGGACGNLRPKNASQNLLTALLDRRYQHLFERERAAQSRFGAVLCCAGPLSAYRRSVLKRVWDRYVNQSFLGKPCTTGDDIHLTVLVLRQGYTTRFVRDARAHTKVPSTLGHYLQQQMRWQRSMYRELAWMLPMLPRWHPYILLDVLARFALPFLLAAIEAFFIGEIALVDRDYLRQDWYLVAVPMIVYAVAVTWQVGDAKFLAYGPVHFVLFHLRPFTFLSQGSNTWGRGRTIRRVHGSPPP